MERVTKFERYEVRAQVALALGGREIPGKGGWVAMVEIDDDLTMSVDRLDCETEWHVSGLFRRSLPVYFNGNLSRCTVPELVTNPELIELLDEELHFAEWSIEQDKAES